MLIDKKHIGMKVPPHSVTPTAWQLKWFAKATGETNPIYFDEAAAQEGGTARRSGATDLLFLHGHGQGCSLSTTSRPWAVTSARCCTASRSFTYHKPVYSGDTLDFDGQVTDIYDKKNGALQFIVKDVKVSRQGEAVCDLRTVIVIRA
jgi:acyl dehydratase